MRKITFWFTLAMIFTIPWEDSITISGTASLTRLLGLAVAGLWFLTILVDGRFRKPVLFHAFVVFFFAWNIVSYLWTANIGDTYTKVKTYGQIFILVLIVWEMFQKPSDLIAGLQAFILGSFVPIVSSLINYLHGNVAESYEVRFSATNVNAVDLALFLLMGLPIAWYLFNYFGGKKNNILRIINLTYLPLALFTILLTASRTSLFAVIPALIYILWPKRFDIGRIIFSLFILVAAVTILLVILPSSVIGRLSTVFSSIGSADIGGRVVLWKESIQVFLEHPLLGSGSGSLNTLINSLSHETYLSVLAETGLIGFALFVCVIVIVLNEAVKLRKAHSGVWLSALFVWMVGVLSLSFEFRKITWLFFSFIIIEGYTLNKQLQSQDVKLKGSEKEESQAFAKGIESNV